MKIILILQNAVEITFALMTIGIFFMLFGASISLIPAVATVGRFMSYIGRAGAAVFGILGAFLILVFVLVKLLKK